MLRSCDVCHQIDEEPRHVFGDVGLPVDQNLLLAVLSDDAVSPEDKARIIAEVQDTTLQQRHFQCCHDTGCPDAGLPSDCANFI